jgi:23S rRNA (adenine2503-C2)-methyltransferase
MSQTKHKPEIKDLSRKQLVEWFANRGVRSFRADQVFKWLYLHQVDDFYQMTVLGKNTRELLTQNFVSERLSVREVAISKDKTRKYLFELRDGNLIESVLIPEKQHHTLCISSQVGCGQACGFCLTARSGMIRNLTPAEIISQVRDICHVTAASQSPTNIVFMGMGEPLANYDNVIQALGVITDSDVGLKFSNRRITLSTAGLVSRLPDLGQDTQVNLAISLNAVDNQTRSRLMPINRKHPIEKLIAACRDYPLKNRKKITIEYILMQGVNDSPEAAQALAKLLKPIKAKINLIPYNAYEGSPYARPPEDVILKFQDILIANHYTVMIRRSKGQDIMAACGQLRAFQGDRSRL